MFVSIQCILNGHNSDKFNKYCRWSFSYHFRESYIRLIVIRIIYLPYFYSFVYLVLFLSLYATLRVIILTLFSLDLAHGTTGSICIYFSLIILYNTLLHIYIYTLINMLMLCQP